MREYFPDDSLVSEYVAMIDPEDPDSQNLVHFSQLCPDPEAGVDLDIWAELHNQIESLNNTDEMAITVTGDAVWARIQYPDHYTWGGHGNSVVAHIIHLNQSTSGEVHSHDITLLKFDYDRPGYIELRELILTTAIEGEVNSEQIYLTESNGVVHFSDTTRVADNNDAVQLIDLFQTSHQVDKEEDKTLMASRLQAMNPDLREAFKKWIVESQPLDFNPERDFYEEWGVSYGRGLEDGNVYFMEHVNGVDMYFPPYMIPRPICDETKSFMETKNRSPFIWSKATWDSDVDFTPFDPRIQSPPNSIEEVSFKKLLQLLPGRQLEQLQCDVESQLMAYVSAFHDNGNEAIEKWGEEYAQYKEFALKHFPELEKEDWLKNIDAIRQELEKE